MVFSNNISEHGKSHHLNFIEFNKAYEKKLRYDAFEKALRQLKRGIWVYFFLLIFEGALRKWVFPGLSDLLLIVRDPVALWLVLKAVRHKLLHSNMYLNIIVSIAFIGLFTALFFGHGNLVVAIYGARIFIVQFPVIFVIGSVFDRSDVIKMGKVLTWMSIPMVLLTAIQFYSPQSAWVNRGIGGDMNGAGFSGGALGFFRPPGTFSFTSGNVSFFCLVSCFILYFWLDPKKINRIILIAATVALIAAIPLSISRGLFFGVTIITIFTAAATLKSPRFIGRAIFIAIIALTALIVLSTAGFFKTSLKAFTERYENADELEGGISNMFNNRIFGTKRYAVFHSPAIPFFGYGMGIGTNVGAKLISGDRRFLVAEEEWGRLIGEFGPTLAFSIILVRLSLFVKMARASYLKLAENNMLTWVLIGFCSFNLPVEQWAQPTNLGFTILSTGLVLAALKKE